MGENIGIASARRVGMPEQTGDDVAEKDDNGENVKCL
jgi:hypothetical protein